METTARRKTKISQLKDRLETAVRRLSQHQVMIMSLEAHVSIQRMTD